MEIKRAETPGNGLGEQGAVQLMNVGLIRSSIFGSGGELLAWDTLSILKQTPTRKHHYYNHCH